MAEGLIILPQVQPPEMKYIHETALEAERLSGSHAIACVSDTSSGQALPSLTADAVNSLTIVPVSNLNSVSVFASHAIAVAGPAAW